jgi:hypothetical protein
VGRIPVTDFKPVPEKSLKLAAPEPPTSEVTIIEKKGSVSVYVEFKSVGTGKHKACFKQNYGSKLCTRVSVRRA